MMTVFLLPMQTWKRIGTTVFCSAFLAICAATVPHMHLAEFQPEICGQFHVGLMAEAGVEAFTDVFVKGLGGDLNLNDEKLQEHFARFGTIMGCKVMVDKYGKHKGCGVVSFEDHNAAQKAVDEMNNTKLEGRTIAVSRYMTKAEHKQQGRAKPDQSVNLYVKNLDETIDDEALLREFSPYGTITSAKVMMANGRSKKFGFVCFSKQEEAEKAIAEMHGKILVSKPLYVTLAQRKADRKAEQNAWYIHGRRDVRSQQAFQGHQNYVRPGSGGPQRTAQQLAETSNQTHAISGQTNFQVEQHTPLTASMLSEIPLSEQKQVIGERLLTVLCKMFPNYANYAPKITGMLLEIDNSELLDMLAHHDSLRSKAEEAVRVLQAIEAKESAELSQM